MSASSKNLFWKTLAKTVGPKIKKKLCFLAKAYFFRKIGKGILKVLQDLEKIYESPKGLFIT